MDGGTGFMDEMKKRVRPSRRVWRFTEIRYIDIARSRGMDKVWDRLYSRAAPSPLEVVVF